MHLQSATSHVVPVRKPGCSLSDALSIVACEAPIDMLCSWPQENMIDLIRGHPSTHLLATSEIAEAASVVLNSDLPDDSYAETRHPLHYGPDLGNIVVRKAIGEWVSERYGFEEDIAAERINLTSGASYGLASILQLCTSPATGYTKQAFMISPTYFLAASVFEDAGFSGKITAIPSTETSIDLALLRSHLSQFVASTPEVSLADGLAPISNDGPRQKRIYKFVLYCVPTYSNPTGQTWDLETRKEVVKIAREWDMLVVSDDVYDFLGNVGDKSALGEDGKLLPSLVSIERDMLVNEGRFRGGEGEEAGVTLSNCSFSKLLGPGLRCGWVESVTGVLAKQMGESGANHSGGTPCHFTSTLIHYLIKTRRIDAVIHNLTSTYTSRCLAMKRAINSYLPEGISICGGNGGFFMWIGLPPGYDAREIVKLAFEGVEGRGSVRVMNGDTSECPGDRNALGWGESWIRIAVSWCDEQTAVEGVRRLGEAVGRWRQGERSRGVEIEEIK